MTPAETIAAAIEKLERLRDAHDEEGDPISWDVHSPAQGELTVTLHRTIDAQLAILRMALTDYQTGGPRQVEIVFLARSILGEVSS